MWFEQLTGFSEESPDQVRKLLTVKGDELLSSINGKKYRIGKLETPSLSELRTRVNDLQLPKGRIRFTEIVASVQELHADVGNQDALFQAASQFNLLEMVGPQITPEKGIANYENDFTQGPACAIACGAGTIFRNYFVPLDNQIGQTADKQIDCLQDIGKLFNNPELELWKMSNGYALISQYGILHLNSILSKQSTDEYEQTKQALRIGIQSNTQVTILGCSHPVTQVYCSALPVSYSQLESAYLKRFAFLILDATYEATILASLINHRDTGSNKVFLTLVGGGAFGNDIEWILDAIDKTLSKYSNYDLDIKLVSYGSSNPALKTLIEKYR